MPRSLAELADALTACSARRASSMRLLGTAERDQVLEVRPPGQREAAVTAAGAGAADVGLDERHVGAGRAALELERRPQAGEAAADDADVGLGVAFEGWDARRARVRRAPR